MKDITTIRLTIAKYFKMCEAKSIHANLKRKKKYYIAGS